MNVWQLLDARHSIYLSVVGPPDVMSGIVVDVTFDVKKLMQLNSVITYTTSAFSPSNYCI